MCALLRTFIILLVPLNHEAYLRRTEEWIHPSPYPGCRRTGVMVVDHERSTGRQGERSERSAL